MRSNPISESPGKNQRSIFFRKRHGHSERDHSGGHRTYLLLSESHSTTWNSNSPLHDNIGVPVPKTCTDAVQERSFLKKGVYRLVLLPLRSPLDNQSPCWQALGGYWMNREVAICGLSNACLLLQISSSSLQINSIYESQN